MEIQSRKENLVMGVWGCVVKQDDGRPKCLNWRGKNGFLLCSCLSLRQRL